MLAYISLLLAATFAPELETPNYSRVADLVSSVPGRVLYVTDLDNTILTTGRDFGGEHWMMWQSDEIAAASQAAIARSKQELIRIHSWIFAVTPLQTIEPVMPDHVRDFAKRGIATLVLTSRDAEMRDSAHRELKRNGFDFAIAAPGPRNGYAAQYEPVPGARPVQYEGGVLFTDGQDKGQMLASLLDRLSERFDSIVFVDDRPHHLANMRRAFANRFETVYTILYTHERPRIQAFNASDKSAVVAAWCAFAQGLRTAIYAEVPVDRLPFVPCANP